MFRKLAIATAMVAAASFSAQADELFSGIYSMNHGGNSSFYVGGAYSHSWTDIDTGGFNTAGTFTNFDCTGTTIGTRTCDDSDDASGASVFFGINNIFSFNDSVSVRGEIEYNYRQGGDYVTGSFPGAPVPAFLYSTSVSSYHTGFVNAYLDFKLPDMPVTLYVGGGLGASRTKVTTTDFVVAGTASDTSFAFNAGGGVKYEAVPGVEVFGDVRYVDLGSTNVPLVGGAAGNYTVDHHSTEIRIGLIFKLGEADLF